MKVASVGCAPVCVQDGGELVIAIVALKDVPAGTELTYDYRCVHATAAAVMSIMCCCCCCVWKLLQLVFSTQWVVLSTEGDWVHLQLSLPLPRSLEIIADFA